MTFLKQHLITSNLLIFITLDNKGVYEEMTFLKQHLITSNLLIFITLDNKGVYEEIPFLNSILSQVTC
jgi:hypothetical protein